MLSPEAQRLVHIHIPKTGGTSINRTFQLKFHGTRKLGHNYDDDKPHLVHKRAASHWPGSWVLKHLPEDAVTLTVLRHPIERTISYYYFLRTRQPYVDPGLAAAKLPLDEFCATFKRVHNGMVRQLVYGLSYEGTISEPDYREACRIIDQIDYVGFTRELNDLVRRIDPNRTAKKTNVTRRKPSSDEVPESIKRLIREHNAFDLRLYYRMREMLS